MIDVVTAGFALFAMLFGAGNLIFPPMLGYQLGSSWGVASFAFILTGVGIPLMGIIASANAGKSFTFICKILWNSTYFINRTTFGIAKNRCNSL